MWVFTVLEWVSTSVLFVGKCGRGGCLTAHTLKQASSLFEQMVMGANLMK